MQQSRWFMRVPVVAAFTLALCVTPVAAQTITWPQQIDDPQGTVVVYQPQFESFKGNQVTGRAAVAMTATGKTTPVFGAFWFTATVDVDQEESLATFRDVKVTNVRWPNSTPELEGRFRQVVEGAVPASGFAMSYERLSASLKTTEREQRSMAELKNEPPAIVFSKELAVLLLYDGEPRFTAIENSPYERAVNTPYAVVRNTTSKTCYLTSGRLWYQAPDPKGPWTPTSSPPADLVQNMPKPEGDEPAPEVPPRVVVATAPTEVIATDGAPRWNPLPGGNLLYVSNTETPWVRNLDDQKIYVLLSGRWFRAVSESGPWEFVRADELPAGFKDIPPGSDIGGIRTSVAGTEEANDAMLDLEIPQTSAIKRDEATFTAQYEGGPQFEPIPGTSVKMATNTGQQILEIGGKYYAADNGVWFVAGNPGGPWTVADSVPEEQIQQIPPSSPAYNVTHLHVYQSTPQVVYVGYTPGYMWSFPYYGVPVYGTGFSYRPYSGTYFYPRPYTFGFHVGYNPWTGWNFGMSWSSGFFRFGIGWSSGWGGWGRPSYRPWGCCSGWYGGGFRGPTFINTGNINIGNRVNIGNTNWRGGRPGVATPLRRDNLYTRPENRMRNADRATAAASLKRTRPAAGRPNNVFADRDGNIARQTRDGWQQRGNKGWERPTSPVQRPQPASRPSIDRDALDRYASSRQRGTTREMRSPSRSRPAPSRPAGRPAGRPGGVRR